MTDQPSTDQEQLKAWVDALNRAEADLAAGRVVDGEDIHTELRASIERIESGSPAPRPRPAAAE